MNRAVKTFKYIGIVAVFTHSFAMPVYAAEEQRPAREERHKGPPEQALLACKGLRESDICSFMGRDETMSEGICVTPKHRPDTTTLACRPSKMPESPARDTAAP
jgi:hypothetical protein